MDSKLKKKWVEALRSGEYKQCTKSLRRVYADKESFCCLGVLTDIALEGDWDGTFVKLDEPIGPINFVSGSLAPPVCAALGLSLDQQAVLVRLNDQHGYSFDEIAHWIEDNL